MEKRTDFQKTEYFKWIAAAFVCQIWALLLEIFGKGAVMRWYLPTSGYYLEPFSYFSGIPYGYAFFSPMLTGVFTVLLLLLTIGIAIWSRNQKLCKFAFKASVLALICSVLVVVPFVWSLNWISASIAVLLGISCISIKKFQDTMKTKTI